MNNIEKTYREISKGVAAIPPLANTTVNHINSVRSNLFFIQELQDGLQTIADEIKDIRDTLLPWKDRASGDTEEIGKLVERYTMHQERMVHIVDHSVAEESMQIEEDIFF